MIDLSENEFEKNLYISLLGNIKNGKMLENLSKKELLDASLEGKTIILSQSLNDSQIKKIANSAGLFSSGTQRSVKTIQQGNTLGFIDERLSKTLGFPLDIAPGKEMTLEILDRNNSLVLTGKLLNGKYLSASSSQKSRIVKLIKCLCREHAGKEKSYFENYSLKSLKNKYPEIRNAKVAVGEINLAREKADRLSPLLKDCIDLFLEISHNRGFVYYKFRRGIDDEAFLKIPEEDQEVMVNAAKLTLQNSVNK